MRNARKRSCFYLNIPDERGIHGFPSQNAIHKSRAETTPWNHTNAALLYVFFMTQIKWRIDIRDVNEILFVTQGKRETFLSQFTRQSADKNIVGRRVFLCSEKIDPRNRRTSFTVIGNGPSYTPVSNDQNTGFSHTLICQSLGITKLAECTAGV